MHRTIEKKVFWEFDSIIMQNMNHNLLLFCATSWLSHQVIENHLFVCLLANRSSLKYPKNEAKRATLQANERILKWRPFWNKVYRSFSLSRNHNKLEPFNEKGQELEML